jgi:trimethylamine--corrinoid protein Co-methyltransferase
MTSSMEMLLLCNEMAGMVRHILRGVPMDRRSLALEVIEAVGPGGNYFTEEHTVDNFRSALHFGQFEELLSRADRSRWEAEGTKSFGERARERARQLIATHEPAALPGQVVEAVQAVSRRRDGEA